MVTVMIDARWPLDKRVVGDSLLEFKRQLGEMDTLAKVGKTPRDLFDYTVLGEGGEQVFVFRFDWVHLNKLNIHLLDSLLDILKKM